MSDLSLYEAIMKALADTPHVHPDEISVEVEGGDVTLRGTVGTLIQHAEAARTTRQVPGVRRVDDRLRVHPVGLDGHGEADDDTEAILLDTFLADDELHPFDIDVRVRDGAARLRGDVDSDEKRERAQRIALRVPGVVAVHNELQVWPSALPMGSIQGEQR